jgi:hypothetical protein
MKSLDAAVQQTTTLLPLPASGEWVGVRGPLRKLKICNSESVERPLTRILRDKRAKSDLSPQAGRGKGTAICDCPAHKEESRWICYN